MKTSIRFITLVCLVFISSAPLLCQQVKTTGTEQNLPNKTIVLTDPGVEQPGAFLPGVEILRFSVYKAGSTDDVKKMLRSLSGTDGIKKVSEGPVSGDMKEFVIELNAPRDLAWYRNTFTKAGFKYIKLNTANAKPISEL
jgi:hypothetical protein